MKILKKVIKHLNNHFSVKGKIERLQYEVDTKKRDYAGLNMEGVELCLREVKFNEEYYHEFLLYIRVIAFWLFLISAFYAFFQYFVLILITPSTYSEVFQYLDIGYDKYQFLAIHIGKFLISSLISIMLFFILLIDRYNTKNRFIKIQALESKLKELQNGELNEN